MSSRKKEPRKEFNLQKSPDNVDEVQPGRLFEWNGSLVEVRSRLGNLCQVIDIHTGASSAVEADVLSRPTRNKIRAVDLEHVSPKDWARAKQIAAVASQLLADHVTDPMVIQRAAKPLGIGVRQMGRWMNNYRESGGLTSSCLARRPGRKRGAVLLTREQQSAIECAIETCTKKPEATSLKEIMREVKTRAKELKSKTPSKESVLRRLDARGIQLSKRKRFGPEKAKEANSFKPGRNVANAPLEQVQIDHTQVDVMVLDDTRTYALGRPWLTLVICVFTRLILGFYLSLKAPSMLSVGRALTVAVSPKEKMLRLFGINMPWSAWGKPREILTDNASEFRCELFVRGCEEHKIHPRLRPLGRKHWGGHIERAIGTLVGEMHLLPGTTFRNTVVKASYVPEARAVLTVRELERWVCQQIVIKNHQEHRSLQGWSPEITWVNYWANHQDHARDHYVSDIQHFYLTFLRRHSAILQSNGIKWATYRYYDPCLEAFPIGKKIEFAVDPSNIRRIWVYDPMGSRHHSVAIQEEPLSDELTIDSALRAARRLESRSLEKQAGLRELECKSTEIVSNAKRERQRATAQRQGSLPVVIEALPGMAQVNTTEKPTQSAVDDFDPEAEGDYVPQLRMPNVREL